MVMTRSPARTHPAEILVQLLLGKRRGLRSLANLPLDKSLSNRLRDAEPSRYLETSGIRLAVTWDSQSHMVYSPDSPKK